MSACEACWTEAVSQAFSRGGHAADHYPTVLAENEERHAALIAAADGATNHDNKGT